MIERRLLIRCDGGNLPEIGTGHVRRCLALASELTRFAGTELVFLMQPTSWLERVRSAGFTALAIESGSDANEELVRIASEWEAHVVFLDTLDHSAPAIAALQAGGHIVISMDDPSPSPEADISISPAFPGPGSTHVELDRTVFLDPLAPRADGPADRAILASFGGFDPGGLALRFLRSWMDEPDGSPVLVAVGADCADLPELQKLAEKYEAVQVETDVQLGREIPNSTIAITNGGTTLFMAAANGTPSLSVAQYDHQAGNARRLQQAGATRFLGMEQDIDGELLIRHARELLAKESSREAMSLAGRVLFPGLGKRELAQTLSIVERLEWDSDFFELEIATLHPRRLTPSILRFALDACLSERIDCLYFLADSSHEPTRKLADENGFRAVDERLTFLASTHELPATTHQADVHIRSGKSADGTQLAKIAGTSYGASRYFHDGRFPEERCEQFYRDWIQKSLNGQFDDEVLVAECSGEIAGYISCRANTPNLGSIGLVGLDPNFRGRGIGKSLVKASLQWFKDRDLPRVEVVTQGRNEVARKLYESCGFVLHRVEKWYHNWLDESRNQS
jgi:spore coat polysaccharide biosynthesis predicted glycosyltransferase SpsG/ribosomal protein S18 acetylase RimI-like enzyme